MKQHREIMSNDESEFIPISDKLFIDLGAILTSSYTSGEETQSLHDDAGNLDSSSNQVPPKFSYHAQCMFRLHFLKNTFFSSFVSQLRKTKQHL